MTRLFALLLAGWALPTSFVGPPTTLPIGVWYEGGVGAFRQNVIPQDVQKAAAQYDRDFADIAAHGVNTIVIPNTPAAHHQPLLDAAQKHGLKLIIELGEEGGLLGQTIRGQAPLEASRIQSTLDNLLAPIRDHPALWKIQLLDEPGPGAPVERYAKIADQLRKYDPAHEPFCCLAGVDQIEPFARMTRSKIVAWDFYPIDVNHKPGAPEPIKAFASAAESANAQARKADAHTWAVIQDHAITGGLRFPTPAEMRAMTWLSLATGSRGIFWFLYGTQYLNNEHTVQMSGLVDEHSKPSLRWDEAAALSKQIAALAPVLLDSNRAPDQTLVTSDAFARLLKDSQGRLYVFAVNIDTTQPRKISLSFGKPGEVAREAQVTHLPDERNVPAAHEGAQVSWENELPAGSAALYRID